MMDEGRVDASTSWQRPVARTWLDLCGPGPTTLTWSLTNPMFASPDENIHLIRSQGVVRGDFSSPYRTDGISDVVCFALTRCAPGRLSELDVGC